MLGLEVAFNDPGVATFGLRNAVLPVGTQFIEVVSPTTEGTAAGRQLERLGGDGGYMVISHTDDQAPFRATAPSASASAPRSTPTTTATRSGSSTPATPAARSSRSTSSRAATIRTARGCRPDPTGSAPCAPTSSSVITGVELAVPDPDTTAARWREILGQPDFDNAEIRWSEGTGGLVAVDLGDGATVSHRIGGVEFRI